MREVPGFPASAGSVISLQKKPCCARVAGRHCAPADARMHRTGPLKPQPIARAAARTLRDGRDGQRPLPQGRITSQRLRLARCARKCGRRAGEQQEESREEKHFLVRRQKKK
jgi:hypothetical protein